MNPNAIENPILAMATERARQIHELGFTAAHDDLHNANGELNQAANAILANDISLWPDSWDHSRFGHIMEKPIQRRLIIAGALKMAECHRFNREAGRAFTPSVQAIARDRSAEMRTQAKEIERQLKSEFTSES